jgi:hypothetical protein
VCPVFSDAIAVRSSGTLEKTSQVRALIISKSHLTASFPLELGSVGDCYSKGSRGSEEKSTRDKVLR